MKPKYSIMIVLVVLVMMFLIDQTLFIKSFGQQTDDANYTSNLEEFQRNIISGVNNSQALNDSVRPTINITYPSYPLTVTTGKIIIQGTASDSGSGIHSVSAASHTFPFNGHFLVKLASQPIPISPNNWSHWSLPLIINNTDSYRVIITATDNAGNVRHAETTINAAIPAKNSNMTKKVMMAPKIAFVRPTFTEAAYQDHGFYNFYFKYGFPPLGKNITTDLDMLTVKTPRSISEFVDKNALKHLSNITSLIPVNGTELHDISYNYFPNPQKFWLPFIDNVKDAVPNAKVTVMRDEDVNDGHIFYTDNNSSNYGNNSNKTNAYDVLILFHNEYVTQQEYDNLRQFVKNGGTIVLVDANIFYAEVNYDRSNHTVTLVKGHSWQYDGKAARRSVVERWYNETKDWVGGNFLANDIKENITFANNPFNYTHFEEQFVNNPKDKIIIDYGIKLPKDYEDTYSKKNELPIDKKVDEIKIATYALDYGKGKVIVLGLTGRLLHEDQKFMKFFSTVILPNALCIKLESCWPPTTNSVQYLFTQANSFMTKQPTSVMDKIQLPPSGNKHDFLQLGPYCWPDPRFPNGLPYICQDARGVNPEVYTIPDYQNLLDMILRTKTLALAYHLTQNDSYASKAADLLRVWFLNNNTKMNPNMKYSELIRGMNNGTRTGIISANGFSDIVDSLRIIENSSSWTEQDRQGMKAWFSEYLNWLMHSPGGIKEGNSRNNHGTWYKVQVSAISLFLNKSDITKKILQESRDKLIPFQILQDGRQPLELKRNASLDYSIFNLLGLFKLANIGEHVGIDLWNFKTSSGAGLQKALDYILPYLLKNESSPYIQKAPSNSGMYKAASLLRQATTHYPDNELYMKAYKSIDRKYVISDIDNLVGTGLAK